MQNEMYGNGGGGQQQNAASMGFGGEEPVRQADQQQMESLYEDPMDYRPRREQR
jgi:hypothetical protein